MTQTRPPWVAASIWSRLEKADDFVAKSPDPSPLQHQEAGDHYKKLAIQPVEYIHANHIPFLEGTAIKYLTRWRDKGGKSDLLKARHCIDLIIELEKL